jgi:hypothetical protein
MIAAKLALKTKICNSIFMFFLYKNLENDKFFGTRFISVRFAENDISNYGMIFQQKR